MLKPLSIGLSCDLDRCNNSLVHLTPLIVLTHAEAAFALATFLSCDVPEKHLHVGTAAIAQVI